MRLSVARGVPNAAARQLTRSVMFRFSVRVQILRQRGEHGEANANGEHAPSSSRVVRWTSRVSWPSWAILLPQRGAAPKADVPPVFAKSPPARSPRATAFLSGRGAAGAGRN